MDSLVVPARQPSLIGKHWRVNSFA